MKILRLISNAIDKVCMFIVVAMQLIFIALMTFQILTRNFFPAYIWPAAEITCRYCFIWSAHAALAMVVKRRKMLCVTLLPDYLKGTPKTILYVLNNLAFIFVLAIVLRYGIDGVKVANGQALDGLRMLTLAYTYVSIPFGAATTIYQIFFETLETVLEKKDQKNDLEEEILEELAKSVQ